MAIYRALYVTIAGFTLNNRGWIELPFNVDVKQLLQEYIQSQSPPFPPSDIDAAEQLLEDFAVWCSQTKGYNVYRNDLLEVG